MATTTVAVGLGLGGRLFRNLGAKIGELRAAWLERGLTPAEASFFNAYSRGGTHPGRDLVIDFVFTSRPRVRELLRNALRGLPLDHAGLEAEYVLWEADPDFDRFRANLTHLERCLQRA